MTAPTMDTERVPDCGQCGHPENVHVPCSLGALVGGWWGCLACNCNDEPHIEHSFYPSRLAEAHQL